MATGRMSINTMTTSIITTSTMANGEMARSRIVFLLTNPKYNKFLKNIETKIDRTDFDEFPPQTPSPGYILNDLRMQLENPGYINLGSLRFAVNQLLNWHHCEIQPINEIRFNGYIIAQRITTGRHLTWIHSQTKIQYDIGEMRLCDHLLPTLNFYMYLLEHFSKYIIQTPFTCIFYQPWINL